MQVRTEEVDLPRALEREARAHYLADTDSETGKLEARVYGAASAPYSWGWYDTNGGDPCRFKL